MRQTYMVVAFKRATSLKEAKEIADAADGYTEIVKVAGHARRCPKGADHAHATYDGATWCDACGQFLTVRLEKRR